jgi:SHS2 domain-containing protein
VTTGIGNGTAVGAGHEVVDHTSELTVRVRAPDFPGLLSEATRAFGELVPAESRRGSSDQTREFDVTGVDRAAVLVEWLNEMAYLCEVDQWLPVEIESAEEREGGVRVRATGISLLRPFVGVKAATLHGAQVTEVPQGLSAEVTLDL